MFDLGGLRGTIAAGEWDRNVGIGNFDDGADARVWRRKSARAEMEVGETEFALGQANANASILRQLGSPISDIVPHLGRYRRSVVLCKLLLTKLTQFLNLGPLGHEL